MVGWGAGVMESLVGKLLRNTVRNGMGNKWRYTRECMLDVTPGVGFDGEHGGIILHVSVNFLRQ